MTHIELITFDLDNTLWDVDSVIREAERVMRVWLAERVPAIAQLSTAHYLEQRKSALVERPDLAHDVTRLRGDVLRRTILAAGQTPQQAERLAQEALEVFLHERHKVKYFDGALEVLDILSQRYTLGALTNGNADVKRLGLSRFFQFGICAADVGASKPDPAIFRAALKHGGTSAEATVHVGDHPLDDIQGATALGIRTIWVNLRDTVLPEGVRPTREARVLLDVPRRIDELVQG